MDKQKKVTLGCLGYILFGIIITYLYFTTTDADLFRKIFDWDGLIW
ncbi:hypothetical protein [Halalkalibacillus sediminis]|nr:hypothetical protein [Halalkalibacillus sediminis]